MKEWIKKFEEDIKKREREINTTHADPICEKLNSKVVMCWGYAVPRDDKPFEKYEEETQDYYTEILFVFDDRLGKYKVEATYVLK
mgnify:CR=1 FL=1